MRNAWPRLVVPVVIGSAALLGGCDREAATPPPPPAQVPEPTAETPTGVGALGQGLREQAQQQLDRTTESVSAAAGSARADAETGLRAQADQVRTQASSAVQTEAGKLLDQAVVYVQENKYELADKALTQVEQMQSLSPALQDRARQVRTLLTRARSGESIGSLLQGSK